MLKRIVTVVLGLSILVVFCIAQQDAPKPSATAAARLPTSTPRPTRNPDAYLNTVYNGGFEYPALAWKLTAPARYTRHELLTDPHRGKTMLKLSGNSNIEQNVTVPNAAPYLRYSYQMQGGTGKNCTDFINHMNLLIAVTGEFTTKSDQVTMCVQHNTTSWVTRTVDLRSIKGKKVTMHFSITTTVGWAVLDDIGFVSAPSRPVDYY